MKYLIIISTLFFTGFCFAQNMGMIVGNVLDKEYNNEPLLYANISIKGTSIQSTSDITGLFHIENLPDGDYTLICGFIGYDTKEVKVHVSAAQPAEVKIPLAASTVSLNELAALDNIAIRNDKTSVASNK